MRDEFTQQVKEDLAKRAGYKCSNPDCKCTTIAPTAGSKKSQTIGVAAHITAAAAGGPRFDKTLSSDERKSVDNGIWLCQNCAKKIDSDKITFTVMRLIIWKNAAETAQYSEFHQSNRALPNETSCSNLIVGLFQKLRKTQEQHEYFYALYNTSFSNFQFVDEICDYLDRNPRAYEDSIKEPLGILMNHAKDMENALIESELFLDKATVDLFRKYIQLARFKYSHDDVAGDNDYMARFFENILDHHKERQSICDNIADKLRAYIK